MKSWFKNSWCWRTGCPTGSTKARQIGLLRCAEEAPAASGCPIDFQQTAQFPLLPESRTDQGEQPGEAVRPPSQMGTEAQQDIRQQGGPDLPLDGALAVAQEVGQLEGLFEFLEED